MDFKLTLVDFDENGKEVPKETVTLKNFRPWEAEGLTEEEYMKRELAIYCDCGKSTDPVFVEFADIPGVGRVDKHGYICRKCGKYVQVG